MSELVYLIGESSSEYEDFVYLIVESSGEYEDYGEVVLGAYKSKEKAEKVVDILKTQEDIRIKFENKLMELNFDRDLFDYSQNHYQIKETRIFDFYDDEEETEEV